MPSLWPKLVLIICCWQFIFLHVKSRCFDESFFASRYHKMVSSSTIVKLRDNLYYLCIIKFQVTSSALMKFFRIWTKRSWDCPFISVVSTKKQKAKKLTHHFSPQALDPQDWNGDNCQYIIFYRRNVSSPLWNNATLTSNCNRSSYILTKLQPNSEYELRIRAENFKGPGPMSPVIRALSGQTTPPAPAKVTVVGVDSSSVEVEWTAIQVSPPNTVDGYWVRMILLYRPQAWFPVAT